MWRPNLSAPVTAQATSIRRACPDIAPILPQLRARKYHKPHCVDYRVRAPVEIAELSQSASAAMSARRQDHASRVRCEQDLNFMIALHECARYLVWPRHHGQKKSTLVLASVEYCALPNS